MPLPIHVVLEDLKEALSQGCSAVLLAPPGAGKTTVVPLAVLQAPWMSGRRLLMLEPRRIAARAAASRMEQQRGVSGGGLVGYRWCFGSLVSVSTRIDVGTVVS